MLATLYDHMLTNHGWNTLQHTADLLLHHALSLTQRATHSATHCASVQHTAPPCNTQQHLPPPCNSLQHTATPAAASRALTHSRTRYTTLQPDAIQCNFLQHTTDLLLHHALSLTQLTNTLQHTATHCNSLQLPATHYNPCCCITRTHSPTQAFSISKCTNTLQHTATVCNSLQHTTDLLLHHALLLTQSGFLNFLARLNYLQF